MTPFLSKSRNSLTPESFNQLLAWLSQDREQAGKIYEEIRIKLIKIFARRGCPVAEELTDETIDRVAQKVAELVQSYSGNPALYFYGVANNVYLEFVKKGSQSKLMPPPDHKEDVEQRHECLDRCIEKQPADIRQLIVKYFYQDSENKVDHRRELAEQLGIPINTMRMRIHRIKVELHDCVKECLKKSDRFTL